MYDKQENIQHLPLVLETVNIERSNKHARTNLISVCATFKLTKYFSHSASLLLLHFELYVEFLC